eukprot:7546240-Alexandrium_andersonii.AAC.1
MRALWNEQVFAEGSRGHDSDKDFKPGLMTEALASNKFFGLVDCVLELHELLASLLAWCEGC